MKRIISIATITLLLNSCDKLSTEGKETMSLDAVIAPAELEADVPAPRRPGKSYDESKNEEDKSYMGDSKARGESRVIEKTPAQIIKNSNAQFQVRDIDASHNKISSLLKQFNAYYGSDNKATNTYQLTHDMVIRVPSKDFEKLMDEVMKESVYTNYNNITAEDVTAEFVDIQARLKTKKEVELRYIALLKQSNKVTDILEVEDKLRVIREEIESSEGRLKLLKDQVGYSTITLNMYQKLDYTPEPEMGFFSNLKEAFVRGWRSMVDVFIAIIRIWPFVIIWLVIMVFVYRRFMKRK